MKVAISGFEKTGKTTLFCAVTGLNLNISYGQTSENEINEGIAVVYDERINTLSEIFKPKKTTYAVIDYKDLPGLNPNDSKRNQKILDNLKDSDLVINVIRAFEDSFTVHPFGTINIERDMKSFESELQLVDMILAEKRIERIENNIKRGIKEKEEELTLFKKIYEHLNNDLPVRTLEFNEEEKKILSPYKFLSAKPLIHLINLGEKDVIDTVRYKNMIKDKHSDLIYLSAKIEKELTELPENERINFLNELGITEPASYKLVRASYSLLGLISYFTVGEDEVRAWTIKKGANAKEAGGKIHSDIERGFIRAEVVSYEDFIKHGGLKKIKELGLLRLEGKDYIVNDGDIMNFRFNV
ncbi:MAG: redox-regulated ATPase YchF [Proteobacteria bacterium]|nr:redox-regulated ATPase YchF [Pseudomonadota bacterium]